MLALDISSTSIGYCYARSYGYFDAYGTIHLSSTKDVYRRIAEGHAHICDLIDTYKPAVLISERNSGTHVNGVIKCAWMVGGAILAANLYSIPFVEVSAKAGKKLLSDNGNADKAAMVQAAAKHFGFAAGAVGKHKGAVVWLKHDGSVAYDEHAADALGLLLAYQAEQDNRLLEAA